MGGLFDRNLSEVYSFEKNLSLGSFMLLLDTTANPLNMDEIASVRAAITLGKRYWKIVTYMTEFVAEEYRRSASTSSVVENAGYIL